MQRWGRRGSDLAPPMPVFLTFLMWFGVTALFFAFAYWSIVERILPAFTDYRRRSFSDDTDIVEAIGRGELLKKAFGGSTPLIIAIFAAIFAGGMAYDSEWLGILGAVGGPFAFAVHGWIILRDSADEVAVDIGADRKSD